MTINKAKRTRKRRPQTIVFDQYGATEKRADRHEHLPKATEIAENPHVSEICSTSTDLQFPPDMNEYNSESEGYLLYYY